MGRTAILIDGGYFIKRFQRIEPNNAHDANRAAECAHRWAVAHLRPPNGGGRPKLPRSELYRVFFYDCPPLEKKLHRPVSGKSIDFKKTPEADFRRSLHEILNRKRKVALRLGTLSSDVPWTLAPGIMDSLVKKKTRWDDLTDDDFMPGIRQKGVDMRIGIDIASLAYRKQVDQIVLIAGDADFVPAAKLARREGIDFILDPMWRNIPADLSVHIDGVRSTCPRRESAPDGTTAEPAIGGLVACALPPDHDIVDPS